MRALLAAGAEAVCAGIAYLQYHAALCSQRRFYEAQVQDRPHFQWLSGAAGAATVVSKLAASAKASFLVLLPLALVLQHFKGLHNGLQQGP